MKKTILITFAIISMMAISSCKKDKEQDSSNFALTADKNQYSPYEIVSILPSENLFTVQSFTARINDIEVIVGSNEEIASFVLPNLSDGSYNLTFTLDKKNYIVPITVSSLSNVLSADQYFNEIQTSINQNISDLNLQIAELEQNSANPNEYANLKNDVIKYTTLLNEYVISYSSLSTVEKQEFAKSMAANKASIDEYNSLTSALHLSTVSLKFAQSVQDYEESVEASKIAFTSSVIYTVGHIPFILAGAQLATTPNPWVSGGAILATGMITGNFLVNVANTASAAITLTNKSLKPFEFITSTSQIIYNSGVLTASDIRAKYRSLINSDSNGSTINSIVENYNNLKNKCNAFIIDLPSIFRPSYIITSLKTTYNTTTRSIYNQYISISDISNPNVSLQQLNQSDGSIKVAAVTSSTSDQDFTYKVNYTNSNFTGGLTQTINAKVLALVDSIPIYTASALGSYTVNGHVGNGPNTRLYCELQIGERAIYTIYDDPSWPNGHVFSERWWLRKINDEYFITTSFTNPGHLINEAQKLSYPVTSFVYRESYVK